MEDQSQMEADEDLELESTFKNLKMSPPNVEGDGELHTDLNSSPLSSFNLDGPFQNIEVSPSKSDNDDGNDGNDEQFLMPILQKETNFIVTQAPATTKSSTIKAIQEPQNENIEVQVLSKVRKRELSPDICDVGRRKIKQSIKKNQNVSQAQEMLAEDPISKEYSLTSPDAGILTLKQIDDAKSQETLLIEQSNIDVEKKVITPNNKPIAKQMRTIDELQSKAKLLNGKENIVELNSEEVVDKQEQAPLSTATGPHEENGNSNGNLVVNSVKVGLNNSKPDKKRRSRSSHAQELAVQHQLNVEKNLENPSCSSSRPKRVATARKRYGIEFQIDEPYRRKKSSIQLNMLSSTKNKSKAIQKKKDQKAIAQSGKIDSGFDKSSSNSSRLVCFATTYSEEDKEILYKVDKFVINKKDAFYEPGNPQEDEDLEIFQIEEDKIRLFEGLIINKMLFYVSTEEVNLVSKEDLYRDYQPIYVAVIHVKEAEDPTKPPHSYVKYFPIDRISPVLTALGHTQGFFSAYVGCLKSVTCEVLSEGFMKINLNPNTKKYFYNDWMILTEATKLHIDSLIELLPWNKDQFKLLDMYPFIRKYDKDDKEVLPTTLCYFCSLNKCQRTFHNVYGIGYDRADFTIYDQEVIDPVCICSSCETTVYVYSRTYHHLFHVYRTMNSNIEGFIEPLDEYEVYRATDIFEFYMQNKYFIQTMFLDFQVTFAECEKLIGSLTKIKEAEKTQNDANQATLNHLMNQSLTNKVTPGPLSIKIKKLEKKIIQAEPLNTTGTNLVNMPSISST